MAWSATVPALDSSPTGLASVREVRPAPLVSWLEQRFGLTPFAMLGSNLDAMDPRWMSFLAVTVHRRGELFQRRTLHPTWLERAFLMVARKITGRYPFYQRQNARQTGLHLVLNGLAGGGLWKKLKLLGHALRPGSRLTAKRLLFQWPAEVDDPGRVVHCNGCPDAVLKDGRLVPLCISDLVTREQTGHQASNLVSTLH